MGSWVIDVQSAGQTVQSAAASAEEYETISTQATSSKDDLVGALTHSEFVHARLEMWMKHCASPGIECVQGMTGVALQGTAEAIVAYSEGSVEMAANAQSTAAAANFPADMPKGGGSASPASPKEH
ncbi:MAG: hypothetical protein HG423_005760 [Propionibacterium sp.]|nr:hypothetical protein [Propionibacterium sp.]